ncbi:hypothetical protein MAR_034175, partial [Mya arenaria]
MSQIIMFYVLETKQGIFSQEKLHQKQRLQRHVFKRGSQRTWFACLGGRPEAVCRVAYTHSSQPTLYVGTI